VLDQKWTRQLARIMKGSAGAVDAAACVKVPHVRSSKRACSVETVVGGQAMFTSPSKSKSCCQREQ
jgi:hypothetical protein